MSIFGLFPFRYADLKRKLLKYQIRRESLLQKCGTYTKRKEDVAKIVCFLGVLKNLRNVMSRSDLGAFFV